MIDAIANRLAVKLKEANPEETASVEVMKYALVGILQNTLTLSAAFIIGLFLGQLFETFIAAISFMILRLVSGGYHFKSPLACFLFSAIIFITIPLIQIPYEALIVINTLSLLLVVVYAPSNIKEHIRVPEKMFPVFKVISIVLISVNYLYMFPVVTLAFFGQSITLITTKKEVNLP